MKVFNLERAVFAADDGYQFWTEAECLEHEKLWEKVQELILPDNPGRPFTCGYGEEDCRFVWYRTSSREDLELIEEYYDAEIFDPQDTEYALKDGLVCIAEYTDPGPGNGDMSVFTLTGMMDYIGSCMGFFGYAVTFSRKKQ